MLDRNYAAGAGGVFWQELRAAFQGTGRDGLVVQDYLVGVGGGDVTPDLVDEVLDDLSARTAMSPPRWMGLEGVSTGDPAGSGEDGGGEQEDGPGRDGEDREAEEERERDDDGEELESPPGVGAPAGEAV